MSEYARKFPFVICDYCAICPKGGQVNIDVSPDYGMRIWAVHGTDPVCEVCERIYDWFHVEVDC